MLIPEHAAPTRITQQIVPGLTPGTGCREALETQTHNKTQSSFPDSFYQFGTEPSIKHRVYKQSGFLLMAIGVMALNFLNHASAEASLLSADLETGLTSSVTPDDRETISKESGTGTLWLDDEQSTQAAPLLQTEAAVSISGIVATVKFKQEFSNSGNAVVEGRYLFPLPDHAAVKSLRIRIGDRTINGMIREKRNAVRLFNAARQQGRLAGLVRQHRPNLFSIHLTNIAANARIVVELDYLQTIRVEGNQYSFDLPLTFTPRYNNQRVPDQHEISSHLLTRNEASHSDSHRFKLNLSIKSDQALETLESSSHAIDFSPVKDGYEIALKESAWLDRDFLLHWRWSNKAAPGVEIFTETVGHEVFMLGMVNPFSTPVAVAAASSTTSATQANILNRELILVMDTSGSMGGEPIRTARRALLRALDGLNASDHFNIIQFSDRASQLFQETVPASPENLLRARYYVDDLIADGGTEIMPALHRALTYSPVETTRVRQVVFITDGAVGYENSVFNRIKQMLGNSRLFTVGIGQAPNRYFMRKAARAGRGTYTFIAQYDQVEESMTELFAKLERPLMTNIEINWLGQAADTATHQLQDLYDGEPLLFSAQLGPATEGFEIQGKLAGKTWHRTIMLDNGVSNLNSADVKQPLTKAYSGISTVWARQKIESLDEQLSAISNELYYQKSQAEREQVTTTLQDKITQLALKHQLLSPFTAFVAIDETASRAIEESQEKFTLGNLQPAGTNYSVMMPQGATGLDYLLLMSVCCFAAALTVGFCLFRFEQRSIDSHDNGSMAAFLTHQA